jgi:hypothetical protein
MEEIHDNSGPLPGHGRMGESAPAADGTLRPEEPALTERRLGSLKGQFTVPDDIKTMFAEEIEEMFYGPEALNKFDRVAKAADERRRQELGAKS